MSGDPPPRPEAATLSRVAIVLVRPKQPGHVGAAARALKTMGLAQLVLVAPPPLDHPDARRMAHGARDILAGAALYGTLREALERTSLTIATTHRRRRGGPPPLSPGAAAGRLIEAARAPETRAGRTVDATPTAALVFGPEDRGLTSAELELCGATSRIPAVTRHPSLNLAQAVMIYAWEIARAAGTPDRAAPRPGGGRSAAPAPFAELQSLLAELEPLLALRGVPGAGRLRLIRSLARFLGGSGATHRDLSAVRRLVRALARAE